MKKRHLALGLAIAALALYFTFRNVSLREVYQAAVDIRYWFLGVALVLFVISFILRAYRWHYLCLSVKPVPVSHLYSPLMIGFMGNLLPLRAGEFIRAYLLARREDIDFSASFATIVVERLFDLLCVLVLFGGLLIYDPLVFVPSNGEVDPVIAGAIRTFGIVTLAVFVGVLVFCYFLLHQQDRTLAFVRFFTRVLPAGLQRRIEEMLRSFTEGLGVLRDPRSIAVSVLFSALLWGVIILMNYPLYYCFRIEDLVPFSSLVTVLVLTAAAVMIPTPGFLGPFQFAITFVLSDLYGVDRATAASFSMVSWFLQMSMICAAGLFFLVRDNISFFEVSRTAREMGGAEVEER